VPVGGDNTVLAVYLYIEVRGGGGA
jgi:hypothetical protein